MRSPITNIWDRHTGAIQFWDGRTLPGEIHVSGNAWIYRPSRALSSGADLLIALPLRRLQVARIPTAAHRTAGTWTWSAPAPMPAAA